LAQALRSQSSICWAAVLVDLKMLPIVRGRCTACGYSRNLYVYELPGLLGLQCDHSNLGCPGRMHVAYAGPKAFIPAELHDAHRDCACLQSQASLACGSRDEDLMTLCEMGFTEEVSRQAIAAVASCGSSGAGRVEAALDYLTNNTSCQGGRAAAGPTKMDASGSMECSICCEDLDLESAVMRCSGQHGKRHCYHPHCLCQWIQQCRRDNVPPTCPECRAELQVRARGLKDFLEQNSSKLNREDVEALRAVHDAALSECDGEGWSGIKTETFVKGLAVGAGVALAGVAIAAALGAFSGKRKDDDR